MTSSRGFAGVSTVALVSSGERRILIDTGGLGDRPGLESGLAAAGLRFEDIDTVVLTHLHFDHAANAELFPRADLVVHEAELAHATQSPHGAGYSAQITAAVADHAGLKACTVAELLLTPGVVVLHTPGHTPGSISVLVDAEERTLVTGDAIKGRADIAAGSPSGPTTDDDAWIESARRIIAGADTVLPGHDVALDLDSGSVAPRGTAVSPFELSPGAQRAESFRPASSLDFHGRGIR
ncbi:N-acyl homoserine lactonase family protein [Rathayibacter sp. PhB185]|uniref:N-acyl homoserine lactonase family protein n=1 Tax=Rathayibacter sp. PhB185 TaxID=2485198 RepID=UPI001617FE9A|nr:N-acyl homoserine lactonase family protein [Rathayibacter sp. PhB185]